MMKIVLSALWAWVKDTQIAKGAATTAVGTSVGFITILGVVDAKVVELKQTIKVESVATNHRVSNIENYLEQRKEFLDFQHDTLKEEMKYMRGSLDAMNQTLMTIKNNTDESRRRSR